MKAAILLAVFVLLVVHPAYNQTSFTESNAGTSNTLTGGAVHINQSGDPCLYVCGNGGVVKKKIGLTGQWVDVRDGLPMTNFHIISIGYICDVAWLYYTLGGVPYSANTTNGGVSWATYQITQSGYVDAQKRYERLGSLNNSSPDTIFVYGDPIGGRWGLMITTDNGQTFDTTGLYLPQSGSEWGWNNALDIRGGYIWFGTNNSRIYRGYRLRNWQALPTPGMVNSYSVWFLDSLRGMVGGESGILYTTNKGDSWTPLSIGGSGNVTGICSNGGQNFWAARGQNIWFSSNNGTSWNSIYTAPAGIYNYLTIDSTRHVLLGIRNNGDVTTGISTIGIEPISNEVPEKFKLEQNYPNPFNPKTVLSFQLPVFSDVKLSVYDVLGNKAAVIVNEELKPGTYRVEWDGTNYSSGVYYYELKAGDASTPLSMTKKMVLVK